MPESSSLTLGKTNTDWALIQLAHATIPAEARELWTKLFTQYHEPVLRALRRIVRDEDVVQELNQEFWLRFVRGDFAKASPERGRFRGLLRTVLFNLVADYYRNHARRALLKPEVADSLTDVLVQFTRRHDESWRRELMDRALAALDEDGQGTRQICPRVLAIETDHRTLTSVDKAALLSTQLGRDVSPENYRQMLSRTRRRFAELLTEEVRRSLIDPTPELVREELAELKMLRYCADAVEAD